MKKLAILLAARRWPQVERAGSGTITDLSDSRRERCAGHYEITTKDGTKLTATINADGTCSDTDAGGKVIEHGTWAEQDDGQNCFTPAADSEGDKQCYSNSEPAADGTSTATPNVGDPLTVKKARHPSAAPFSVHVCGSGGNGDCRRFYLAEETAGHRGR